MWCGSSFHGKSNTLEKQENPVWPGEFNFANILPNAVLTVEVSFPPYSAKRFEHWKSLCIPINYYYDDEDDNDEEEEDYYDDFYYYCYYDDYYY